MNRREFTALIAGSFIFPQKLWSSVSRPPDSLVGLEDDDHVQYYPLYFRRSYVDAIYELWQPGIVLGVAGGIGRVELHSPHRPSHDFDGTLDGTLESMDIVSAFRKCMGYGMVVVVAAPSHVTPYRPYRPSGALEQGFEWNATSKVPLLLRHYQAVSLCRAGELEEIEPKYTHKEYVELCYEREKGLVS